MRLLACTLRDAVCILVAATLSFRALKVAWNNSVDLLPWSSVTFSVALIAAFMAVAYFAFLRRGAGPALAAVACADVGIAQSFICAFKGVAILPSDLLALGTAAAVSAGYDYVLTPAMLDALGLLCIVLAILSLIRPPKLPVGGNMSTEASSVDMPKDLKAGSNAREDSSTTDAARPSLRMTIGSLINRDACPSSNTAMRAHTALGSHPSLESSARSALTLALRRRWNIVAATASVVLAVVCGNSIQGWFNNNHVTDALEISFDNWQPINTYVARGWIPSFSIMVQNLAIPEPDDYTAESAQAAEEERAAAAAQFDSEKPTVIAIMNETFADLSIYNGLNAGYVGPTYYNNLAGVLQRGSLAVSVLGGGTCSTEFEFLTGNSLGFIGGNKYPYTLYDFGNVASPPAVQGTRLHHYGHASAEPRELEPLHGLPGNGIRQVPFRCRFQRAGRRVGTPRGPFGRVHL